MIIMLNNYYLATVSKAPKSSLPQQPLLSNHIFCFTASVTIVITTIKLDMCVSHNNCTLFYQYYKLLTNKCNIVNCVTIVISSFKPMIYHVPKLTNQKPTTGLILAHNTIGLKLDMTMVTQSTILILLANYLKHFKTILQVVIGSIVW